MRTSVIVFAAMMAVGCSKKAEPQPAAKAPVEEPERVIAAAPAEEPEQVVTAEASERGSCQSFAERVVELALEKEEEPAFRKKDVEALTEGCKAAEDTEAKKAFGDCIDGAADLEAAKKDCDVVSTAKGWLEPAKAAPE